MNEEKLKERGSKDTEMALNLDEELEEKEKQQTKIVLLPEVVETEKRIKLYSLYFVMFLSRFIYIQSVFIIFLKTSFENYIMCPSSVFCF